MNMILSVDSATMMPTVADFTIEIAADRDAAYDTLLHKGRRVADVEARIVEAQFRRPDGSTLLLLNDDQPFKEVLTIMLVSAGLEVLDELRLGGAFTPGFLTYAYPSGPDEVAFCWHDLDQLVSIRRHRSAFGLRPRWLKVREVPMQLPASSRALLPQLREAAAKRLASLAPRTRRLRR